MAFMILLCIPLHAANGPLRVLPQIWDHPTTFEVPTSEHGAQDVRVMVALNGEVELTLDDIGTQNLTGASLGHLVGFASVMSREMQGKQYVI